jgi:hypothetical protein
MFLSARHAPPVPSLYQTKGGCSAVAMVVVFVLILCALQMQNAQQPALPSIFHRQTDDVKQDARAVMVAFRSEQQAARQFEQQSQATLLLVSKTLSKWNNSLEDWQVQALGESLVNAAQIPLPQKDKAVQNYVGRRLFFGNVLQADDKLENDLPREWLAKPDVMTAAFKNLGNPVSVRAAVDQHNEFPVQHGRLTQKQIIKLADRNPAKQAVKQWKKKKTNYRQENKQLQAKVEELERKLRESEENKRGGVKRKADNDRLLLEVSPARSNLSQTIKFTQETLRVPFKRAKAWHINLRYADLPPVTFEVERSRLMPDNEARLQHIGKDQQVAITVSVEEVV